MEFSQYLIDRKGKILGSYASSVVPQDKLLSRDIERALRAD